MLNRNNYINMHLTYIKLLPSPFVILLVFYIFKCVSDIHIDKPSAHGVWDLAHFWLWMAIMAFLNQ